MKRIAAICLFLTSAFSSTISAQSEKDSAEITFVSVIHDFGKVTEGSRAVHGFIFSNTGNAGLTLTNVSPSCSCSLANWPKDTLKTGEKSFVNVLFNSQGRPGIFEKTFVVQSNAKNNVVVLTIKGEVVQ